MGTDFVYDAKGNRVINEDGSYAATDGNVNIGSIYPDFTGGWTNTFRFKNFDLSVLLDFSKGGNYFSTSYMWGMYSGMLEESAAINENGVNIRESIANGGGVCAKSYLNSQMPGTKFCTPDYSIVSDVVAPAKAENTSSNTTQIGEKYMFEPKTVKAGDKNTSVLLLQEILKSQGLDDAAIEKIVGEMKQNKIFTASEENLDTRYSKLKGDHDGVTKQLTEAQTLIAELKKGTGNNEALQGKISEYENTVATLKAENEKLKTDGALKVALLDAGAKAADIDYLLFKAGQSGNIKLGEDGKLKGQDGQN
jgi:hypothetical protein